MIILTRIVLPIVALFALAILLVAFSTDTRSWLITQGARYFLRDRFAYMPPQQNAAQSVQTVKVRMRDGVLLDTHIYLPEGKGPWPVIVVRDPYSFAKYVSCTIFVHYGYACVHQDVRGRGESGGEWYAFVNERNDGIDTFHWILTQPWQNRNLALWGESYLGIDQWVMADELPPEVKTLVAAVSHGDVYQTTYHNGMFVEGVIGAWSESQFQPWYKIFTATQKWKEEYAGKFPALGVDKKDFGRSWPTYRDYLMHPEKGDSYWQSPTYVAMRNAYKGLRVPVFMIGRNNDFFLPGMLDTYKDLPTRNESVFYLAPGDHGGDPGALKVDHPHARYFADTLAWFDHFLKGKPLPPSLRPGYTVYVNGADRWQHYSNWPDRTTSLRLYLDKLSDAHRCDGGVLSNNPGSPQSAHYRYNPRDPVPTRGGNFIIAANVAPLAVQDQKNDLCNRPDVLSFSSAVFPRGRLIAGSIHVKLLVASDAADTAFTVKLSEHFADGRVFNIRDDISSLSLRNGAMMRMEYRPGDKVEVEFKMIPVAWQMHAGSRLRLDVSSSNFPSFNPHPNKAGLWSAVDKPIIATQSLFGGSIEIPVEGPIEQ